MNAGGHDGIGHDNFATGYNGKRGFMTTVEIVLFHVEKIFSPQPAEQSNFLISHIHDIPFCPSEDSEEEPEQVLKTRGSFETT